MPKIQIPATREVDIKEIRMVFSVGTDNTEVTLHSKGGEMIAQGSNLPVPEFLDGSPMTLELHVNMKGKILNWNDIGPDVLEALYSKCEPVEPELEDKPAKPKKPRKPRRKKGESDADYAKRVAAAADESEDKEAAE